MDEMKITSKFMTGLISVLAEKALKNKLGTEADIQLSELSANTEGNLVRVHLDVNLIIEQDQLVGLLLH